MKKISFIFFLVGILGLIILPLLFIGAQDDSIEIPNPLAASSFDALINKSIDFIFWVAIAVAPIMVLIAGFNFLTAGGDPKKVDAGKKIILYTVIGLAIILMARGLIGIINQVLQVQQPPP